MYGIFAYICHKFMVDVGINIPVPWGIWAIQHVLQKITHLKLIFLLKPTTRHFTAVKLQMPCCRSKALCMIKWACWICETGENRQTTCKLKVKPQLKKTKRWDGCNILWWLLHCQIVPFLGDSAPKTLYHPKKIFCGHFKTALEKTCVEPLSY